MNRRLFKFTLASLPLLIAAPTWAADAFPSKSIKVIVPYPAGGVVDVQTRVVTQAMEQFLKQAMVVEPRPGASGSIAAEAVSHADPDGYTLLVSASFLNTAPLLENNLRWQTANFTPVGRFALSPSYFVVSNHVPAKSMKAFAALAKKADQTGKPLQYANGGNGTPQQIAIELFKAEAGIQLDPVMYKGAPPSVPDLINGLVAVTVLPSTVAYPQIKSGRIRALANTSGTRSPQLPDVPTIAEAGYPGATVLSWYGLHAPAGTPPEVIAKLDAALRRACADPLVKQRLQAAGGEEAFLDTPQFTRFLAKDAEQWAKAVKEISK